MKLFQLVTITLGLLSLVLSACGGIDAKIPLAEATPMNPAPPQIDLATISPLPPPDLNNTAVPDENVIERAKSDLMERLGVTEDQILVLAANALTWPDVSLGCPQPGMTYAKVTTPGYLILLEASGEQYRYHTDLRTNIVLCQEDALPSFPITPGEIDDGVPWMPVD